MNLHNYIDKTYSKQALVALYFAYLKEWVDKGLLVLNTASPLHDGKNIQAVDKAHFIEVFEPFFSDEKTFKAIFETLSSAIQVLLVRVIFEKSVSSLELEQEVFTTLYDKQHLKQPYALFKGVITPSWEADDVVVFSLHDTLLKAIKPWVPAPYHYNLHPFDRDETDAIFSCEESCINSLPSYHTFVTTQIKRTKTGGIVKTGLKSMQKSFGIEEFYPREKNIGLLRTQLLVHFLDDFKAVKFENSSQYLKEVTYVLLNEYSIQELSLIPFLETHLKSYMAHPKVGYISELFQALALIVKEMPTHEWVSFDNIFNFVLFRDLTHGLRYDYANCHVLTKHLSKRTDFNIKTAITSKNYYNLVTKPLYKGALFLLSSLGMINLSYISPIREDSDYEEGLLSYFDGIKAVQLTPLGAYCFGRLTSYEEKKLVVQKTTVQLSEQELVVYLQGDDPVKKLVVDKVALQQTNSLYSFDYELLYKGCSTKDEVLESLEKLFTISDNEVPAIWKKLFSTVNSKMNPMSVKEDYTVLDVAFDKELIYILGHDTSLKRLVKKAEEYMLVVKRSDLSTVKQRLRKYGYFFE